MFIEVIFETTSYFVVYAIRLVDLKHDILNTKQWQIRIALNSWVNFIN